MISPDEALLVLKGWRDAATSLYVVTVAPDFFTLQLVATVTGIQEGTQGTLLVLEGKERSRCSFGLRGATFEYADERSTLPILTIDLRLPDAICAIKVAFANGALIVLVEGRSA